MSARSILWTILAMFLAAAPLAAVEIDWSVLPSHSPAEPARGDTVTISGEISVSDGDATNLRVIGGMDETTILDRTFALVRSGETRVVSFTYSARPGSHNYWMNIDPDDVSGDVSPTNNLARGGFRVADPLSRPDLHIWWSSFSVVPTRFLAGDPVTFHVGFGNIGTADAGPFDVGIRSGGVIVARQRIDGMAAGANTTVDLSWTAACNEDNALVVDCDNTVAEPNEEDNTVADDRVHCDSSWHQSLNFTLDSLRPDTSRVPLEPRSGPTTVAATLRFTGSEGSVALNVRVEMGIVGGAPQVFTFPVLRLPDDAAREVSFKTVLPAGNNRVFFEVDTDRRLAEMNEGDNRLEGVIRVTDPGRAPAPAPSALTRATVAIRPLNYGVAITNKAELASLPPSRLLPLKVRGRLKVTGVPAAAKITASATLDCGAGALPVRRSLDLTPAADAEVPFEFSFPMPAPGACKVKVEIPVTDADAADNRDSAAVKVITAKGK